MRIIIVSFAMIMMSFNSMADSQLKNLVDYKVNKQYPGAKLYADRGCVACHGDDANTPSQPQYPKLAGQNKDYIIAQINDIKNGLRNNGRSIVMRGTIIVDQNEIDKIAEWLSSLPIDIIEEQLNSDGAKLFQDKSCSICHGIDAKSPSLSVYPKLAGQNKIYSLAQMKDIKSGKRNSGNSATMQGLLYDVTTRDMAIIANWLESLTKDLM
ncbi:MAG TPA: c-type cytochrome [Thioploca sp.]|nr:c-type cytochrome [Thioploca sp.]